jgi:hypothetical protein
MVNSPEFKAKIAAAEKAGTMSADQARQESADLDAKNAGQIEAFRARWQAESARLGIPQARIDADANTLSLDKQAEEARAKLLGQDRVTVRDETPKELAQAKGKGGGGGVGDDALARFVDAAGALVPGAPVPGSMAVLARKAGIKANQISGEIDRYRGSGTKAEGAGARTAAVEAKGAGGVDPTKIVRDVDGTPLGTLGSVRAIPALQSDLRTNMTALKQLKALSDDPGLLPTGPKFHDAVLALAATTTAGKTDTTTSHEKGAITNMFGMPDKDAIQRKIDQLQERVNGIHNQLTPLPDDYQPPARSLPDKARAAKASLSGETAPAPAAAQKVPASVIEQAKAEVKRKGPHAASAAKLLDQQGITVL